MDSHRVELKPEAARIGIHPSRWAFKGWQRGCWHRWFLCRSLRGGRGWRGAQVGVLHDPVDEVAGLGVDARVARLCTAVTPGHNTAELVATHEGAPGVALARVLPALVEPGADHAVSDVALPIRIPTVVVGNNGHSHLGFYHPNALALICLLQTF